ILERSVTAAPVEVADEGRSVSRSKYSVSAADPDAARRVACVLHELAGCGATHDLPCQARRYVHPPVFLDAGARLTPQPDRFLIAPDFQPDLLEHPVGVTLHGLQPLFRQQLVRRDCAGDVRRACRTHRPLGLARFTSARTDPHHARTIPRVRAGEAWLLRAFARTSAANSPSNMHSASARSGATSLVVHRSGACRSVGGMRS